MRRRDLEIWAARKEVRLTNGYPQPGERCQLRIPKEMRHLMKGFFFVFGDGPNTEHESDQPSRTVPEPQWRFYWHLTGEAAAPFIAAATSTLNTLSIPFRLKVPRDPDRYRRADAGVLYLARRHAHENAAAIHRIYEAVASLLRPETPLLTCRLADGLALAEAPIGPDSYGRDRCRLIAQALWESFASGRHDRADRFHALTTAFQSVRLDPQHPYLAPGSTFDAIEPVIVAFSDHGGSGITRGLTEIASTSSPMSGSCLSPLDAAVRIGRKLCESAHWDRTGRLCNWVGRSPVEVTGSGTIVPAAAALGPELYAGSAGVALFLAQLHALTGDAELRRTALGASARSLHQVLDRPDRLASPLSLFAGRLGVAYAALRVAAMTGCTLHNPMAEAILDGLDCETLNPPVFDVIGGHAGAILALLSLSKNGTPKLRATRYRDRAIGLGEELCREAVRNGRTWSWNPGKSTEHDSIARPLTGMSHGASGIAVALLELHAVTRRSEFLEAARGGFAYEDSLFDAKAGNWPDLRVGDDERTSPRAPTFCRTWCHGAPGIALARLRAVTLDLDESENHLAMARAAIGTTLLAIEENLPHPGHDASLCHGLAGLLETVVVAGRQLGDITCLDKASTIARVLIDRHAGSCNFPSGLISCSVTPSLMLGLAGTGHAFLRLHAVSEVGSILLPGFQGP